LEGHLLSTPSIVFAVYLNGVWLRYYKSQPSLTLVVYHHKRAPVSHPVLSLLKGRFFS